MSCVYFIGGADWRLGRVKIGVTRSRPEERLASLQTGSPVLLELYGYVPGGVDLERMLHSTFAPVRLHGEWFSMDGKLLALVSDIYGQKFGRMSISEDEFLNAVSAVLGTDDPPHHTFCTVEEWMDSAHYDPMGDWISEKVWAMYQRQKATAE